MLSNRFKLCKITLHFLLTRHTIKQCHKKLSMIYTVHVYKFCKTVHVFSIHWIGERFFEVSMTLWIAIYLASSGKAKIFFSMSSTSSRRLYPCNANGKTICIYCCI